MWFPVAGENLILVTKYIYNPFAHRTVIGLPSLGKAFRDFIFKQRINLYWFQPSFGWFSLASNYWYTVCDGRLETQKQFVAMELKEIS